jgi:hypothetical protein
MARWLTPVNAFVANDDVNLQPDFFLKNECPMSGCRARGSVNQCSCYEVRCSAQALHVGPEQFPQPENRFHPARFPRIK